MISIEITADAYEAIRASLVDPDRAAPAAGGFVRIWLEEAVVNRLKHLRGRGESYSDVILRLAKEGQE